MKYTKLSFSILIVMILILGVTCINVFAFLGFWGAKKWKEEVQLSDGRIIVVERKALMEGGGDEWAINRGGTKPKEYRIRFAHPDGSGKMIEWRSAKESPRTYPEKPLILDLESGQPIVYTIVAISSGREVYSKYAYRNGIWIEETLPDMFEKRFTNLNLKIDTGFIDLETKLKNNTKPGYRLNIREVGPQREVATHRRR